MRILQKLMTIAALLLLAVSCKKEDEDLLPKQRERMVQYLTSSHAPRLVAEEEVESGTEQPFYSVFGNAVYRYIDGYYNPDRASRAEVSEESKVTITFRAYRFNFTNIVGVLRGGGDVRAATVIDLLPLWAASIPAAALFGLVLKWGVFWVYVGISLDQLVKFFLGIWRLRSGEWINDLTVTEG